MAAEKIPNKPEVTEIQLVQDMAETVSLHGYNVTEHTVKHNHEREETLLLITSIDASHDNHRRELTGIAELAESMRLIGLMNPLQVVRDNGRYRLVAGHRRLAAAALLKWKMVPGRVLEVEDRKGERLAMAAENFHRVQLTPLEEAATFQELLELGVEDLTGAAGVKQEHAKKRLGLLGLPAHIQKALAGGDINLGEAQELCKLLTMPSRLAEAWTRITKNHWNAFEAVKDQLHDQARAERLGKLREKIKADGLKLVEIPQNSYQPKGCTQVGDRWDGVPLTVAAHKKFSCHRVTLPRYDNDDLGHWCANPTSHPEYVAQQKKHGRTSDPKHGSAAAASRARNKLIGAAKTGRYDALRKMVAALRPETSNRTHDEIRELVLRQRLEYCLERKGYQCDLAAGLLGLNENLKANKTGGLSRDPGAAFEKWAATAEPAISLWILELAEMQQLTENTAAIAGGYLDSSELVPQRLAGFYRWIQRKGYKLQEGDVATITHLAKRNKQLVGVLQAKKAKGK
jgi:ParB/RepB/Spo0J family partition protein